MALSPLSELAAFFQAFEGVLADRLEHEIAVAFAAEQALVDQRGDGVEAHLACLFGRFQRATACEHSETGEGALLVRR